MFSLIFDEMPTDNYFYIGGLETLVSEDYEDSENYQEYEDYEDNKTNLYYDELLDYYDSYYDDYNDY